MWCGTSRVLLLVREESRLQSNFALPPGPGTLERSQDTQCSPCSPCSPCCFHATTTIRLCESCRGSTGSRDRGYPRCPCSPGCHCSSLPNRGARCGIGACTRERTRKTRTRTRSRRDERTWMRKTSSAGRPSDTREPHPNYLGQGQACCLPDLRPGCCAWCVESGRLASLRASRWRAGKEMEVQMGMDMDMEMEMQAVRRPPLDLCLPLWDAPRPWRAASCNRPSAAPCSPGRSLLCSAGCSQLALESLKSK